MATLPELNKFDHDFFDIPKHEADNTDVNTRIALEVVYEAIADAGLDPQNLGEAKVGLFFARWDHNYDSVTLHLQKYERLIAYKFNLRGITCSIDSACASSFQGVYGAVLSMRQENLDAAIVLGATTQIRPHQVLMFQKVNMVAPDSKNKVWDAK